MPRSTDPRGRTAGGVALDRLELLGLLCSALVATAFAPERAAAQVVFDDTLTTAGVAPLDVDGKTYLIEQSRGTTVSGGGHTNLFYSFERFDVPAANTAEFRPEADVNAIVSRVTGGSFSRIDGDIRVSAIGGGTGPDLFLVNPAGVSFGGATRIDMNGALRVSTASGVGFADGGVFSAADTGAPLPTSAAPPSLLRFDGTETGEIEIEGRVFSNDAGGMRDASGLAFVARDVTARGSGAVAVEKATLEIGAVGARAIDVPLDLREADLGPGSATGGRILVDAGGASSSFTLTTLSFDRTDQGRIVIRGGQLVLANGGLIAGGDGAAGASSFAVDVAVTDSISVAGASGKIESQSGQGFGPGSIRIRAGGLEIADAGKVEMTSNRGGGLPGRLEIEVESLSLSGANSQIKSLTQVVGEGADLDVRAQAIRLSDDAAIFSESQASASVDVGAVGDIAVTTGSLVLEGGAKILSVTNDAGNAGQIAIDADSVALESAARVLTETRSTGLGGDVSIRAASLSVADQSSVTTGSTLDAASGDVEIEVGTLLVTRSSAIGTGSVSPVVQGADPYTGPGGRVTLVADSARIEGGSQISTSTDGAGDAGDLELDVRDALVLTGKLGLDQPSGLFARSGSALGSGATGDGGRIVVRAGSLRVEDGAQINSTTVGGGRAGAIDVETLGELVVDGGRVSAISSDVGATGDIRLAAGRTLRVLGGSEIDSEAPIPLPGPVAPGDPPAAGGIELAAGGRVLVRDSRIATDSARPESGDVRIGAARSISLVESSLTTNVDTPSGRGGDVALDTQALVLAGSRVTANAEGANADAGNIALRAGQGLLQSSDSVVEARAELGVSGVIVRATPDTNLPAALVRIAATTRDDDLLVGSCQARESAAGSFSRRSPSTVLDSPEALLPETSALRPGPAADPATGSAQERDACPSR